MIKVIDNGIIVDGRYQISPVACMKNEPCYSEVSGGLTLDINIIWELFQDEAYIDSFETMLDAKKYIKILADNEAEQKKMEDEKIEQMMIEEIRLMKQHKEKLDEKKKRETIEVNGKTAHRVDFDEFQAIINSIFGK